MKNKGGGKEGWTVEATMRGNSKHWGYCIIHVVVLRLIIWHCSYSVLT